MLAKYLDESGKELTSPFDCSRLPGVGEIVTVANERREVLRYETDVQPGDGARKGTVQRTDIITKEASSPAGAKAAHGRRELREG